MITAVKELVPTTKDDVSVYVRFEKQNANKSFLSNRVNNRSLD